jgi:lysophospholipase L1-like esterase
MRTWVALGSLLPVLMTAGSAQASAGGSARPVPSGPARAALGRYVALGDSFTAGPFIPHRHGTPIACLRSDHNYPSLVARMLQPAAFTDVSCSAATTDDMTRAQPVLFGHNIPQLDAVTAETTLVTVGIGGNDIGYSRIVLTCATLSLTAPHGSPCTRYYGATLDRRVAATAPKVAGILRAVRARAPRARVLLVGYPRMLPARTGCWPTVPAAAGDVPFLDRFERRLNAMLAEQARLAGADFVDAYTSAGRHDMCAADRWVEGIVVTSPAAPVHPNARGMQAVADRVLAVLGASRVTAD